MSRILLCVDDEQAVLNQLSTQLARAFSATHRVECAESADEALELMEELHSAGALVEVVIVDQIMPGMTGERFLEAVNQRWPDVMKILLTGQAGLDAAIYAINRAGLHRYIEKPWEAEDLILAVQNLVTLRQLKKDVELQHERLERRSRELRSLSEIGILLGSSTTPSLVLGVLAAAAQGVARSKVAAAVAQIGTVEGASWDGDGAGGTLGPVLKRALEEELARRRADGAPGSPDGLPEGLTALVLERGGLLFGWLLLAEPPSEDAMELLPILLGQAAASLSNLELVEGRLESERLSTIGRMISTVIHDLRNPMTAIKGYGGMLSEFELGQDRQKECARLIVEECDRVAWMIEEILEFVRGRPRALSLSRVTMPELAGAIARLTEPDFRARGLRFGGNLGYEGPVLVDVERMKRAILNIASNAADAMAPGGVFTFTTRLRAGRVEILLSDTGRGIPEDVLPRIFEPFFTHGKARGIGLGMSVARKIIEEHGGMVHVESKPGVGTCFTVSLPVAPPHPGT